MRIDPVIAALRRDRSPQRRAQAAMFAACAAWRADTCVAPALEELDAFGRGAPLESGRALAGLFHDPDRALALVEGVVSQFCAALADQPFGHPALRHGLSDGHATLQLASSGRAQLVLHGGQPGHHAFEAVRFSDAQRYETVLAGRAAGRLVRRAEPSGRLDFRRIDLMPGLCLGMDLSCEALQVLTVERQMVVLRLQRTAQDAGPSREYALADGALLHQASGNGRSSREEMMIALLGRMGRADAAPIIAGIAREPGDESLRWQALRECLALDTAEGFRALAAVACRADDPLSAPAGALRAQLAEAHPQLLLLEDNRCLES